MQTIQHEEERTPRQFFAEAARPINAEKADLLIQDDLEYADDANLLIGRDTHFQSCERMGNYDISTETREPIIQWLNVLP